MKINLFLTMAVIICLSPKLVHSSDVSNIQYPMFKGVERVFIYIEYPTLGIKIDSLPKSLQPENITKMVLNSYKKRFSSKDCSAYFKQYKGTINPYECNDQPVLLVTEDQNKFLSGAETSFATTAELHDTSTLFVVFTVSVGSLPHSSLWPVNLSHVATSHFQFRPNTELPLKDMIARPSILSVNQTEKEILLKLEKIIMGKLN